MQEIPKSLLANNQNKKELNIFIPNTIITASIILILLDKDLSKLLYNKTYLYPLLLLSNIEDPTDFSSLLLLSSEPPAGNGEQDKKEDNRQYIGSYN